METGCIKHLILNNLIMEANKILSADVLDLIFEDRNKDYGAYDLRKTYNKRIILALVITASVGIATRPEAASCWMISIIRG